MSILYSDLRVGTMAELEVVWLIVGGGLVNTWRWGGV